MKFIIFPVLLLIAADTTQCLEQKIKEQQSSKGQNGKRSIYGELNLGSHIESIDNQLHGGHLNLESLQDSIILEPGTQFDQIGSAPVSDEDSVVVESANSRSSLNDGLLIQGRNLNLNQGGRLLVQIPSTYNVFNRAPVSDEDSIVVESANSRPSLSGGLLIPAQNLNLNRDGGLLIQLPPTLNALNSRIPHTQVEIQRSIELEIPQPALESWSSQENPIQLEQSSGSLKADNIW